MKCPCPRLSAASTFSLLLLSISKGSQAHHCQRLDSGSCATPSIKYGWDIDGSQRYGYLPTNENDFPHGWSPDIATIESFICNRLESPCNAQPDTVERCRDSFNLYSGLSGDDAINAWNSALGSTERDEHNDDDDTHYCSSAGSDQSYLKATTKTSTIETTSTHTRTEAYTMKTHEVPSPSSILTTTSTLPSSPTTTDHPPIPSTLQSSTETQATIQTTTTTTDPASSNSITAASTDSSSSSPTSNSNSDDSGPAGGDGGGSPFSLESAAPTLSVLGNEGPLKLVFLLSLLALLIALW